MALLIVGTSVCRVGIRAARRLALMALCSTWPAAIGEATPLRNGIVEVSPPLTYVDHPEAQRRLALAVRAASTDGAHPVAAVDPTTQRKFLVGDRAAALVLEDWQRVIARTADIRALEPKPAMRQLEGIVYEAVARAMLRQPYSSEEFEDHLRRIVGNVDGSSAASALRALRASYLLTARSSVLATMNGRLAAQVSARKGQADIALAANVLEQLFVLKWLVPELPAIERVLADRLAAGDMQPLDRWSDRQAALPPNRPWTKVTVGIWDSGVDTDLFKGQLWTNANEKPNGVDDDHNGFVDDIHGFAFDSDRKPTTGLLGELPTSDERSFDRLARYAVGWSDLDVGALSEDARYARLVAQTLSAQERGRLDLELNRLSFFTHGTGIASIAMEGNPAIELVVGRMAYRLGAVPQPIDEKDAAARIKYADMAIGYFRQRGARLVNMSFRLSLPNVEGSLAPIEADPQRRRERALAIYNSLHSAFERAVRASPETLFLTSAGNSNEDNDAVRSFPAGIDADNLIVVGAVDAALMPADISSFGRSVDIYALGVAAPQRLVGGRTIRYTGTSSATPQVTNLAAKILTLCPKLTVRELKDLILSTATSEGSLKLPVVNPRAALARLKTCPN